MEENSSQNKVKIRRDKDDSPDINNTNKTVKLNEQEGLKVYCRIKPTEESENTSIFYNIISSKFL